MASDNETAEMWREWGRQRAAKRAGNRDASAQMLKQAGIPFESKFCGKRVEDASINGIGGSDAE